MDGKVGDRLLLRFEAWIVHYSGDDHLLYTQGAGWNVAYRYGIVSVPCTESFRRGHLVTWCSAKTPTHQFGCNLPAEVWKIETLFLDMGIISRTPTAYKHFQSHTEIGHQH